MLVILGREIQQPVTEIPSRNPLVECISTETNMITKDPKTSATSNTEALRDRNAGVEPERDQMKQLAHQLWQARGCPEGSPEVDWINAEQQMKNGEADVNLAA